MCFSCFCRNKAWKIMQKAYIAGTAGSNAYSIPLMRWGFKLAA